MLDLPIHPFIVHIPLGLSVLMPLCVLAVMILAARGILPTNTWVLIILLQVVIVLSCLGARFSGNNEASYVANYVAEELLDRHEERANIFLFANIGLFIVALLGSFVPLSFSFATRLLFGFASCAVAALGIWAGQAGSDLVYKYGGAGAFGGGQNEEFYEERSLDEDDELLRDKDKSPDSVY